MDDSVLGQVRKAAGAPHQEIVALTGSRLGADRTMAAAWERMGAKSSYSHLTVDKTYHPGLWLGSEGGGL